MKKKFIGLISMFIALISVFAFISIASAQDEASGTVTLAWDANSETNLAGYKLYYDVDSGAPYQGTGLDEGDSPITILLSDLSDQSSPTFSVTGVPDGEIFFALTAFDLNGLESGYSNEVSTVIDLNPPAPPSSLRAISVEVVIKTVITP